MRGKDEQQLDVFSYVSPEQRVPQDQQSRNVGSILGRAVVFPQPARPGHLAPGRRAKLSSFV